MSHSSSRRGQTEPLAALVAVSTFAIAIGLYAVFVGGVFPGTTDRSVEDPTADRVWDDIQDDGVYRPASAGGEPLATAIDTSTLPDGQNVYVEVTAYTQEGEQTYAEQYFDERGDPVDWTDEDGIPPDDAPTAEQSISVEIDPGRVRGGTLTVVVWS